MNFKKFTVISLVISPFLFICVIFSSPAGANVTWSAAGRGMGEAYTASASGLDGISYNPANNAVVDSGQFVSNFSRSSQQSVDVDYGSLGIGFSGTYFSHGLAVSRTKINHGFDNFQYTSGLQLDYSHDIYYYNLAVKRFIPGQLAANFKYFSTETDMEDVNATGEGLDLGYLYELNEQLRLGVAVSNIIATRSWDSGQEEDIARETRAGLNYRFDSGLTLAGDLVNHEGDNLKSFHLGVKKSWKINNKSFENSFYLAGRMGMSKRFLGAEEYNLSLGLSLYQGRGRFTYAFQERTNFENKHVFGYSFQFGTR